MFHKIVSYNHVSHINLKAILVVHKMFLRKSKFKQSFLNSFQILFPFFEKN